MNNKRQTGTKAGVREDEDSRKFILNFLNSNGENKDESFHQETLKKRGLRINKI